MKQNNKALLVLTLAACVPLLANATCVSPTNILPSNSAIAENYLALGQLEYTDKTIEMSFVHHSERGAQRLALFNADTDAYIAGSYIGILSEPVTPKMYVEESDIQTQTIVFNAGGITDPVKLCTVDAAFGGVGDLCSMPKRFTAKPIDHSSSLHISIDAVVNNDSLRILPMKYGFYGQGLFYQGNNKPWLSMVENLTVYNHYDHLFTIPAHFWDKNQPITAEMAFSYNTENLKSNFPFENVHEAKLKITAWYRVFQSDIHSISYATEVTGDLVIEDLSTLPVLEYQHINTLDNLFSPIDMDADRFHIQLQLWVFDDYQGDCHSFQCHDAREDNSGPI